MVTSYREANGTETAVSAANPLPVSATLSATGVAQETTQQAVLAAVQDTSTINVAQDTAAVKNGATSLTPKFAAISTSASGDSAVVAAVVGKQIRVLDYLLMGNGAVNAKFRSATTDITGLHYIASAGQGANGGGFSPIGKFQTVAGEALNINLSGAVAVGGWVVYVEV